jgi:formylglycine-generating enzyme required for sulfatase activity
MNGGNITKNTRGSGAGVYTTGTFIMNGGVIGGSATDKNDATYGGGVYIATGGEFTMNGGEISYNDAVTNGGGVSINSTGVFTMNGGVINGNTASTGAGIFNTGAVFNISGNALVDENNEVYLASGKTITVTGPLTQPQALKVTLNSFTLGTPVLTPGFPAGTIGKIGFTNGARSLDSDGKLAVVEPAMRYVPPTPSSGFAFDNSGTTYYSEITTGYWMGETEVTQELWEAVMTGSAGNLTPSSFSSSPASDEDQFKRPVERISWYDALEFCNRLSEAAGKEPVYDLTVISRNTYGDKSITAATVDATWTKNGYRLPTEMEWWWAATGASMVAGTAEKAFSGSTGTIMENAWYQDGISSPYVTHQVGLKLPNELGIHDMTGNVSEWCWDWHDTTAFYGNHTNYTGPLSGTTRVVKGGYHASMPAACTLNYRDNRSPGNLVNYIGVRVVCNQ